MHAGFLGHLSALRTRFDGDDPAMRVNPRTHWYRRDEAEFVSSVVHHIAISNYIPVGFRLECGKQAQSQEAMRDRAAEGTLLLAALDVDVNPLMVAGDIGKAIDFFL